MTVQRLLTPSNIFLFPFGDVYSILFADFGKTSAKKRKKKKEKGFPYVEISRMRGARTDAGSRTASGAGLNKIEQYILQQIEFVKTRRSADTIVHDRAPFHRFRPPPAFVSYLIVSYLIIDYELYDCSTSVARSSPLRHRRDSIPIKTKKKKKGKKKKERDI